jgi:hypothetical protein
MKKKRTCPQTRKYKTFGTTLFIVYNKTLILLFLTQRNILFIHNYKQICEFDRADCLNTQLASAPKRDDFYERATATPRAFSSVIIADHSDWYEGVWLSKMKCREQWVANWRISQCKHIQTKLSYPSINCALRGFYSSFCSTHSGLLCIAVPINRMMTLTLWKSENLSIEVVLI